ncbi:hypothetical protein [Priestia filamentosa]|uniref:hypothetical protein n=1 Tax=Priestia filamentosa TaxID=1402861 RepID=UPI000A08CA30|nr:hypothetical protein [Priestia filamentosa]OXS69853.1 hypothetical protein B1B01_12950 [Priestia filamentosa]SMF37201.1 hypothetical protein SAMN06296056_1021170 [Priestia filamentosa]
MWCIPVHTNNISFTRKKFSSHASIITEYTDSETELHYFTSIHTNSITDPKIAYYKLLAILKCLNSIIRLHGNYDISYQEVAFKTDSRGNFIERYSPKKNEHFELVEYEQLSNPFSKIEVDYPEHLVSNPYQDFMELASKDTILCANLILYYLANEQILLFLINMNKILENIVYDMERISPKSQAHPEVKQDVLQSLRKKVNEYKEKVNNYKHFMNTEEGSGLLSRHGVKHKWTYKDKERPSMQEMDYNLVHLLNSWLNYKLYLFKGYYYNSNVIYQEHKDSDNIPLENIDFNFDI